MDVTMLLKIAGLGVLASIITTVLKQNGRDELATITVITALVIGSMMMLDMVATLLDTVRSVFSI